jgi:hypothetical protein
LQDPTRQIRGRVRLGPQQDRTLAHAVKRRVEVGEIDSVGGLIEAQLVHGYTVVGKPCGPAKCAELGLMVRY